jgi:hypothetical protein
VPAAGWAPTQRSVSCFLLGDPGSAREAFGIFCLPLQIKLCWKLPKKSVSAPWLPWTLRERLLGDLQLLSRRLVQTPAQPRSQNAVLSSWNWHYERKQDCFVLALLTIPPSAGQNLQIHFFRATWAQELRSRVDFLTGLLEPILGKGDFLFLN